MRTSQGIWSLFQKVSRKNHITGLGTRAGSSSARKKEIFDASKLVLDLEAADSKYVRKFEETFNYELTLFTEKSKKLASSRVKQSPSEISLAPQTTFDIFQATPPDFLCYALLGGPSSLETDLQHDLHRVFKRNGLAPRQGRFHDNIKWLRANARSAPSPQSEQFVSKLLGCSNISEIRRSISFIANTSGGAGFLASNCRVIVDVMKDCHPIALLKIINALIQLLETEGLDPGPVLVEAGMFYAAAEGLLPSLKYYIARADAKNYAAGRQRGDSIMKLANSVVSGRLGEGDWGKTEPLDGGRGRAGQWHRRHALELLTGWEADGVPKENEKRAASFATIIHKDQAVYRCYIEALATLHASEALLYEFMHPDLVSGSDDEIARLFWEAFLDAGGVPLARQACDLLTNGFGGDQIVYASEDGPINSTSLRQANHVESEEQIMKSFLARYCIWRPHNLQKGTPPN